MNSIFGCNDSPTDVDMSANVDLTSITRSITRSITNQLSQNFATKAYVDNNIPNAVDLTRQIASITNQLSQNFATKAYVDNTKQIVTVWAETRSSLSVDAFEWSFGARGTGSGHSLSGYPMPTAGTLIGMGLSLSLLEFKVKVVVTIDSVPTPVDASVTKNYGSFSEHSTFRIPIQVGAGTRINFQTKEIHERIEGGEALLVDRIEREREVNTTPSAYGVVSLLIELDP